MSDKLEVHVWAIVDTHYKPRAIPVAAFVNMQNARDDMRERNDLTAPGRYIVVRCEL